MDLDMNVVLIGCYTGGGKPALPKIMDRPEPAWLLGSRAFVIFFSIYFRLPIDTKYLKCYLYIIINNKTKKQTL